MDRYEYIFTFLFFLLKDVKKVLEILSLHLKKLVI